MMADETVQPDEKLANLEPDYGVLPPFDGTTLRTAFPVNTQRMILDWFVGGRSIEYLVRWFHCETADIEHVLRVALGTER